MIRLTSSLLLLLVLAACGGSDGSTSVGDDADVRVFSTSPAEVYAGDKVVFSVTVTNEGPASASDVLLEHHLNGGAAQLATVTCAATGGAECPAGPLGASITVAELPAAGGLLFSFEVQTDPDWRGSVTSALAASADADSHRENNVGESTSQAVDRPVPPDPRNGDYITYGSNGRQYTLTLDFNEMTYRMVGSQVNRSGTFTPDDDGVGYVFSGTARFRVEADLVVGGFNFNFGQHPYDRGVRPFIAARSFTTDIAAMKDKSYNLMGLKLRRNDNLEAVVLPSKFGDKQLHSCLAPVPVKVDLCPAELRATYDLVVSGDEIVGTDPAREDLIHFRLARSGSMLILLQADDAADDTGRQFRVGLADTPSGLAGGSFATSSTTAAWGTTTLTDTRYAFSGMRPDGGSASDGADLAPLTNVGPAGLRRGNRTSDSASVFLGQNDALMLMLGAADGPAEGTMDIGLR